MIERVERQMRLHSRIIIELVLPRTRRKNIPRPFQQLCAGTGSPIRSASLDLRDEK